MAVTNVGDLREITWKNPDAGPGRYFSKKGETHSLDPGGLRNGDDESNLDSSGTFIMEKYPVPWCYEAVMVISEGNKDRKELESLTKLAASLNPTQFTFSSFSGVTYAAEGAIVGEIKVDRQKGTLSFKAMGGGNIANGQFATQI